MSSVEEVISKLLDNREGWRLYYGGLQHKNGFYLSKVGNFLSLSVKGNLKMISDKEIVVKATIMEEDLLKEQTEIKDREILEAITNPPKPKKAKWHYLTKFFP